MDTFEPLFRNYCWRVAKKCDGVFVRKKDLRLLDLVLGFATIFYFLGVFKLGRLVGQNY
jgi:hypothetical protein